jgi:O-antigen/teichoic acid export membrane protein
MVFRNSLYNLLGLGLPLLVAIAAIPALINSLGVEQFGILTIVWAIVSYFGLFDLGLGRAMTQQVAATVSEGAFEKLGRVVGTSNLLMAMLGLVGGILLFLTAPLVARELGSPDDRESITWAFRWMALAMPAIILTSGYRGILEALGQFGIVNAIRLPMGIFTYGGPLLVVWSGAEGLAPIAAVLCAGRIFACLVHAVYAKRALPPAMGARRIDRSLVSPLLRMGGWLSVSNVVSPLMNYVDRFLIAFAISASAVAYYATPQELVMRVGIIPTALASVLFPLFAAHTAGTGVSLFSYIKRYSLVVLAVMLPFTVILVLLAHPLLAAWITPGFADRASLPLQIMAIAALFSGLAQVPYTMLQGRARADLTAKLHLVELPAYLILLYVLLVNFGVVGAAAAWLIRIAVDMTGMYLLCKLAFREDPSEDQERAVADPGQPPPIR